MRGFDGASLSLFVLLLLQTGAVWAVNHLADSDCTICHLGGSQVVAENAHLLAATQKRLCVTCHEKSVRLSHRSEFRARAVAPLVYPLNWKGEMVCSTCHLIHAPAGKMLRGTRRGKEFCLVCHEPKYFTDLALGGIRVTLSAHEPASLELLQHELDPGSIACLRCHRGLAGRLEVFVDPALVVRHAGLAADHDHPLGRPTKNADALVLGLRVGVRPAQAPPMPGGRMSCLSCHRADGQPHGRPLHTTRRQKLCKECHEFKQ